MGARELIWKPFKPSSALMSALSVMLLPVANVKLRQIGAIALPPDDSAIVSDSDSTSVLVSVGLVTVPPTVTVAGTSYLPCREVEVGVQINARGF